MLDIRKMKNAESYIQSRARNDYENGRLLEKDLGSENENLLQRQETIDESNASINL